MIQLLRIELEKLFLKGRSYVGFIAVSIIVLIVLASLKLEGEALLDFFTQQIQETFFLQGNLLNGYLATYIILNSLWLHIPILIILICGEMVSGEVQAGTIRLLMIRPVSRFRFISAKFVTALIYTFLLVFVLAALSLVLGLLLFGEGDLIVFMQTVNIFKAEDVLWRFIGAFGFGILSMWVVGGLAFLFSTIMENSLGAMLASLGIVIVLMVFSTLELGLFSKISPYLFTTYLSSWRLFFEWPINSFGLGVAAIVLAVHLILFYVLSVALFLRKDILA